MVFNFGNGDNVWSYSGGGNTLETALNDLSFYLNENVLGLLLALAAVGVLSMNIVQIVKYFMRPFYHEKVLKDWLGDQLDPFLKVICGSDVSHTFYLLAPSDFYDRIGSGIQSILDYPYLNYDLLKHLTGSDGVGDDIKVLKKDPNKISDAKKRELQIQAMMSARSRIKRRIETRFIGFRKDSEYWWSFRLHSLSLLFSILIIYVALYSFDNDMSKGEIFSLSVGGGMLAPVAHSLSQAIKGMKRG